jgi:uncharacterized damage-inducible protein DinB
MSGSLLDVAFAHTAWATSQVIDACLDLSIEQLRTNVLGTRGPIIETLRHVVTGDAQDLFILTGDPTFDVDFEDASLPDIRVAMEGIGAGWSRFISSPIDPDAMVREVDSTDGYERTAPVAFRLAGTLQHGADHRSQICTALTSLGIEPPAVDVMSYGVGVRRVMEKLPGG